MALGKTAIKGGIAALFLAVMTVGASAWEAYATASVNVRSGPSTGYQVIDVLHRNQVVDVEYCRSGWCFIDMGRYGRTGWASQNYLAQAGSYQPPVQRPPVYQPPRPRPQPPYWGNPNPRPPHWNPGPQRPPHWNPPPRPRPTPPNNSEVCFNGPNGYFCIGD